MLPLIFVLTSNVMFILSFASIIMMRKSFMITLIAIEAMLLSVNLSVVSFSFLWQNSLGQVLSLIILSIGAAEIIVGLGILVIHYHVTGSIFVDK